MKIGYLFRLHSGVSRGCFNISLIMPTIQSIRSMLHFTWLPEKFSIIMFLKYLDITPFIYMIYDLYTLFIEKSPNMRGQLSWFQSDSRLLNIHHALRCLVPKVNVKATDPCLCNHYTVM